MGPNDARRIVCAHFRRCRLQSLSLSCISQIKTYICNKVLVSIKIRRKKILACGLAMVVDERDRTCIRGHKEGLVMWESLHKLWMALCIRAMFGSASYGAHTWWIYFQISSTVHKLSTIHFLSLSLSFLPFIPFPNTEQKRSLQLCPSSSSCNLQICLKVS